MARFVLQKKNAIQPAAPMENALKSSTVLAPQTLTVTARATLLNATPASAQWILNANRLAAPAVCALLTISASTAIFSIVK